MNGVPYLPSQKMLWRFDDHSDVSANAPRYWAGAQVLIGKRIISIARSLSPISDAAEQSYTMHFGA